jgi:drug/metabolite transporter (DMT)-like permease
MNMSKSSFANRLWSADPDATKLWRGYVYAAITVIIWVGFILIAKASSHGVLSGLDIAAVRIIGSACVLLPTGYLIHKRNRLGHAFNKHSDSFGGLSPLGWSLTLKIGLFGGLLYATLAYSGFFFAPASHASVLLPGSLPLWTSIIAWLVMGDKTKGARLIGLLLILCGDLIVGGPSLLHALDHFDVGLGDLLFVSASISWSYYTVLVRQHKVNPVYATTAITVFAFFTYLPGYFFLCYFGFLKSNLLNAPTEFLLFQMIFQGVFSVVVSGITFNQMVRYFGPVKTTMFTAAVPGLSAIGAGLLLDESLSSTVMLGLLLVTLGIFFGVTSQTKKSSQ